MASLLCNNNNRFSKAHAININDDTLVPFDSKFSSKAHLSILNDIDHAHSNFPRFLPGELSRFLYPTFARVTGEEKKRKKGGKKRKKEEK